MYKIYLIRDINHLEYVGKTKLSLNERLRLHRNDRNRGKYCSSQKLDLDNCVIELLQECDDSISSEIEQYWMDNYPNRVNKNNATYDRKQYYIDNRDEILENKKVYYNKNKDKIKQYNKQLYIDNKEKVKLQMKQYYIENKDKIKQYDKKYRIKNKDKKNQYDREYRYFKKYNDIISDFINDINKYY